MCKERNFNRTGLLTRYSQVLYKQTAISHEEHSELQTSVVILQLLLCPHPGLSVVYLCIDIHGRFALYFE